MCFNSNIWNLIQSPLHFDVSILLNCIVKPGHCSRALSTILAVTVVKHCWFDAESYNGDLDHWKQGKHGQHEFSYRVDRAADELAAFLKFVLKDFMNHWSKL